MAVLLVVVMIAGCGGDADSADTTGDTGTTEAGAAPATTEPPPADDPPADEPADDPEGESGDAGGSGGVGDLLVPAGDATVAVDGTQLTPQNLLRCIPFSDDEGDLDLQVLGDGFILFIYVSTGGFEAHELSMQGSAIGVDGSMGVFSGSAASVDGTSWIDGDTGEPVDGPPFEYTGDRVSGMLTISDVQGGQDPIEVSFDTQVPPDVNDCSL